MSTTAALLAVGFIVAPVAPASADALVNSPAGLAAEFTTGGTVTLDTNIDVSATDAPIIVGAASVTLDLAGHQLSIVAKTGYAGIGVPAGANLTVSDSAGGGSLIATAGAGGGAGIGGNAISANSGNITITGGTVTAQGSTNGAGIGGASGGSAIGTITITGGTVAALAGASSGQGAGIGGGYSGNGGPVNISGGTVEAIGGLFGSGIGGGYGGAGGAVTIGNDAVVTAYGVQNVVGAGRSGTGFGSLSNAGTLIFTGATLTIPAGITVVNSGVIRNQGALTVNGVLENTGSIILTAVDFEPIVTHPENITEHNYVVTFNAAPAAESSKRVFATSLTDAEIALPVATRVGYSFTGWFTTASGSTAWTADSTISGDVTVYAQWTADPRTVSFDAQGGSTVAPITTGYGSAITTPTVPTLTGHTFAGWYTTATSGGSAWNFATGVTENITLYARWTADPRTVSFDAQGGTTVDPIVTSYGSVIAAPTIPTFTGHTFAGWYTTAASAGSAWNFGAPVTENVTVYARWTADPRTVSFDAQGGTTVSPIVTSYGSVIAAPTIPTFTGHTFAGWYTTATSGGSAWNFADGVTASITLYARWTADLRIVTFDVQGGTAVDSYTTEYGTVVAAPAAPTRTGHTFVDWFTAASGGSAWNFADAVTESVTVYAQWTTDPRTLSFDARGGTAVDSITTSYGSAIAAPTAPTRTGYTFAGWFTAASGGSAWDFSALVTANATVYAQWRSNATAAPATGETLRMISTEPTTTRQDIDTTNAQSSNPVSLTGLSPVFGEGSDFSPVTHREYLVTSDADPLESSSLKVLNSLTGAVEATVPLVNPASFIDAARYYDLDIDANGLAHILVSENGTGVVSLATVDLTTGVVTLVGAITGDIEGELMGLASSPSGVFYATDRYKVFTLAVTAGGVTATTVGGLFSNRDNVAVNADFDSNGVLWLNTYNDSMVTDLWSYDITKQGTPAFHVGEFSSTASTIYFVTPLDPTTTLSATTVTACGQVTVTGENFAPNAPVKVTLSPATSLGSATATAAGAVLFSATIPAGTAAGAHTITLTDAAAQVTASATITVAGTSCESEEPVVDPPVVDPPVVDPPVVDPPVVVPPVVDPPVVVPPAVNPPVVVPPIVGKPTATGVVQNLAGTGVDAGLVGAAAALLLSAGLAGLVLARRRRATS
ncbi:InlB B-repeat-containing protein [Leifsonia kafniensis]|uniref:InlB B-repeat-containing protein n=1 Tax=Leifsonia kafniensis TaxID=475957 RepID=UPI0031EC673E